MEPMLMTRDGRSGLAPALQQGEEELCGVEDPLHVEVEHPIPGRGVVLGQRCPPGGPGIVDQHVDPLVVGPDPLGESPGTFFAGKVGGEARTVAIVGELGDRGLNGLVLARGDDHGGSGDHEATGDHPADAPAAAGHHHGLAGDGEEVGRWSGCRVVAHGPDGSADLGAATDLPTGAEVTG